MDITIESSYNITVLTSIARAVLGSDTLGASVSNTSTIHLDDNAPVSAQNKAQKIFDNWGDLSPAESASSMVVGDANPTITQASPDPDLLYVVLLDGAMYSSGSVEVVAGTATLTLVDPEAGVYDIYFARATGDFSSGFTTITVSEV